MADEAWVDTVRLARDLGDVSGLFPAGISRLRDIPFTLLEAIKTALAFLSFEEMRDEDRPPRSIWTNIELLNEHMDAVRRKYRSDDDGGGSEKPARNAAARSLVVG